MHLLIPFAFCSSEGCRQALPALMLPVLQKLLRRLSPEAIDTGDEASLSPPHERALARALNLPMADGRIAWAALQAQRAGLKPGPGQAWAFITPCHWHAGAKHVAMNVPELADFTEQEALTLMTSMQAYFAEDGITLHYDQPGRWLASSEAFDGLASASLDRVSGRDVADWLPRSSAAMALQRLQSEMQMLLYQHPVNDARAARGVPSVNSFWISGTGALPEVQQAGATAPIVVTDLRAAALREDWPAWRQAWQTLDVSACTTLLAALDRGESCQLTLCGERNAQQWVTRERSVLTRFIGLFGTKTSSIMLEKL
jgi:hypothetical protein